MARRSVVPVVVVVVVIVVVVVPVVVGLFGASSSNSRPGSCGRTRKQPKLRNSDLGGVPDCEPVGSLFEPVNRP